MISRAFVASLLLVASLPAAHARAGDLVFVLDASGSMWGQVDGVAKITTARSVLSALLGDLPEGTRAALVSYGDQRERDCSDVTVVAAPGALAPAALAERLAGIQPKGKTPIASSLERAGDLLGEATGGQIVLISDGIETCGGDPCATAAALAARGVDVRIHVVGFDVDDAARAQLACVAERGNGRYFDARDVRGFEDAIADVKQEVAAPAPTRPMGLEAWWRFDECDAREEYRRFPGTVHGDPRCVDGRVGKALAFDGQDDWVEIDSAEVGNLGLEATLAFWYRPTKGFGRVVEKDYGPYWVFTGGVEGMSLFLRASTSLGKAEATLPVVSAERAAQGPGWTFVALRKRGPAYDVFVDGVPAGHHDTPVNTVVTTANLTIARSQYWKSEYFAGAVDEVRVYSRALEDPEIQALYAERRSGD